MDGFAAGSGGSGRDGAGGRASGSLVAQELVWALLFETEAVRVAPEDKPFWYASGTLGPFYCNTHFLLGGEAEADAALYEIDAALANSERWRIPELVCRRLASRYAEGGAYKRTVDAMAQALFAVSDAGDADIVSGGERRDWFFSFAAARLLDKGHATIFKDMSVLYTPSADIARLWDGGRNDSGAGRDMAAAAMAGINADGSGGPADGSGVSADSLRGLKALHVSDLVTEASSYGKLWIPALKAAGVAMTDTATIVDRLQGGGQALARHGVMLHAVAELGEPLFDRALAEGRINAAQHSRVLSYLADPVGTMRAFLRERPGYIAKALITGGKDAERARLCMESGVYFDDTAMFTA